MYPAFLNVPEERLTWVLVNYGTFQNYPVIMELWKSGAGHQSSYLMSPLFSMGNSQESKWGTLVLVSILTTVEILVLIYPGIPDQRLVRKPISQSHMGRQTCKEVSWLAPKMVPIDREIEHLVSSWW